MMSSKTLPQVYDVFMSFRGDDTRMGFTSHLYDALIRNGIRTYKDDKTLEIGKLISAELLEAIETSRFTVVVLSNSYATSTWCLEEIAKVVDCMKNGKMIVIPVFYHVTPSDVRHQSNCFEQGFTNHEADPEIPSQKVETWRAAFTKIGNISGLHVTQHTNEAEVISEIVRRILKDRQYTLPIDLSDGLVGIESREDVKARIILNQLIVDGTLEMTKFGVFFRQDAEILQLNYCKGWRI
ncbi:toll/interleukin-1 receptor-like protein [Rutidosis leptorrhynchoides]|uniref:toll/interleukin-1 receptor-like protein n=1 Tax=Rutidosis leptorrhynchoides TaxID=125765 RepID=UPI003A992426